MASGYDTDAIILGMLGVYQMMPNPSNNSFRALAMGQSPVDPHRYIFQTVGGLRASIKTKSLTSVYHLLGVKPPRRCLKN